MAFKEARNSVRLFARKIGSIGGNLLKFQKTCIKAGLVAAAAGMAGVLSAEATAHMEFQNNTDEKIVFKLNEADLKSDFGDRFDFIRYMYLGGLPPVSYMRVPFYPDRRAEEPLFKDELILFSHDFASAPLDGRDLHRSIRFTATAKQVAKYYIYTSCRTYSKENDSYRYHGKIRELNASGQELEGPVVEKPQWSSAPPLWPGVVGTNGRVLFHPSATPPRTTVESKAMVARPIAPWSGSDPAQFPSLLGLATARGLTGASTLPGSASAKRASGSGAGFATAAFARESSGRVKLLSTGADLDYVIRKCSITRKNGQPVQWLSSPGRTPTEFELDKGQGCTFTFDFGDLPETIDQVTAHVDFSFVATHPFMETRHALVATRCLDPETRRVRYQAVIEDVDGAALESKGERTGTMEPLVDRRH